jgi:MHS family proline/betaine transporter-like MFS transporter
VLSGAIGNALEWYDFSVYGYLAVPISHVFFPGHSAQLLLTFATFGVGFLMRPVGSIVLGHYGDRIGRRPALLFTVGVMSISTFLVGVLPSFAVLGIWAPLLLLLLRLVQGFSAGGEWGGSAAFLVEFARPGRRGLTGSFQQFTTVVALLAGAAAGTAVTSGMSKAALDSWGWRLPFLFGIVLGAVALYLRMRVPDTPRYEKLEEAEDVARYPLVEIFRTVRADMARLFGLTIVWTVAYYVFLTYLPTYLETDAGFSDSFSLAATMVELAFLAALIPFMGRLSDRIGRKRMLLASCVLYAVLPYPLFAAIGSSGHNRALVIVVVLVLAASVSLFSGPGPAAVSEMFPTRIRYSALSIPYNVSTAIFGGFAPFIATALIQFTGNDLSMTFYVIAAAVVSFLSILTLRDRSKEELR